MNIYNKFLNVQFILSDDSFIHLKISYQELENWCLYVLDGYNGFYKNKYLFNYSWILVMCGRKYHKQDDNDELLAEKILSDLRYYIGK